MYGGRLPTLWRRQGRHGRGRPLRYARRRARQRRRPALRARARADRRAVARRLPSAPGRARAVAAHTRPADERWRLRALHHLIIGAQPIQGLDASNVLRPGVAALVKCLAKEVGPRVRVNSMAPGRIDTARSRSLDEARAQDFGISTEEQRRNVSEGIPLGRYGEPAELGRAAAFLALPRRLLHHRRLTASRRWARLCRALMQKASGIRFCTSGGGVDAHVPAAVLRRSGPGIQTFPRSVPPYYNDRIYVREALGRLRRP